MNLAPLPTASQSARSAESELRIYEPLCAVFRQKLKSVGLKYTPERARILDAIIRRDDVFQAEELLESMKKSGFRVSKATIYRTIKLLADSGIIQQVLFDSEQAHYLLAYGRRAAALIVRVDSRKVEPIDVPEITAIRDRLCAQRGLVAEGHRMVIYARGGD